MMIIPAIDIINGKCVRLTQGNFNSEKVYSDNPVDIAKQWESQGAKILHVIDLDGAKKGKSENLKVIKRLAQTVNIPIQVGGGIRNKESIKTLLSIGVSRVILGTVALDDTEELKCILTDYASQVAIALDTKNGTVMKQGWLKNSQESSVILACNLEALGAKRFIYTDIIKDGTLTEPNYKQIAHVRKNISVPLIASGGISTIRSIKKLKSMGVEGVIIGKALYEGIIDLKEAFYVS